MRTSRLHDFKNQETYYGKIVERYMKFCASSSSGQGLDQAFASLHTPPHDDSSRSSGADAHENHHGRPNLPRHISSTERPNDMPNILLAMRKLREGILASRRRDIFAQRAYKFVIHAGILARSWESYRPALLYLIYTIHPHTPLSVPDIQEFAGYHILDLACRQYELGEAFRVQREFQLRQRKVDVVLRSLVHDDWVRFWRSRQAVDGYQRAIMEFAVERMRLHALKCIGRGYMNANKAFIERTADGSWEDLVKSGVGWQLQENNNVVIRKPKSK